MIAPADPLSAAEFAADIVKMPTAELAARYNGRIVAGTVNLRDFEVPHRVELRNVTFADPFIAEDARFARTLDLSECRFERGLLLDGSTVEGCFFLRKSYIHQLPDAVQLRMQMRMEPALSAVQLQIKARADFYSCTILGDASLVHIVIGGLVSFNEVKITGDLELENARIAGSLLCICLGKYDSHPAVGGSIRMPRARIGGAVDFSGLHLAGTLSLVNTEIEGGFFCGGRSNTPQSQLKQVTIECSSIKGDVYFRNVEISEKVILDGSAFYATSLFLDTTIRGKFQAARTTFEKGLFLGDHEAEPYRSSANITATTTGAIDLSYSRIGGELRLAVKEITCPAGVCVNLSFATVDGTCQLPGSDTAKKLELYHAQLCEVRFGGSELPKIAADGLSFRELELPGDNYILFLDHADEFSEANYRKIERHLRDQGRDAEADKVYREMRRRDRREELGPLLFGLDVWRFGGDAARRKLLRTQRAARKCTPVQYGLRRLAGWLWSYFLDRTIGYGTQSYRVGVYLACVFLLFCYVFSPEQSVKRKYHATVEELAHMKGREEPQIRPSELKKDWRTLDAMAMAARVTIPLIEPAVDADWEPSGDSVLAEYGITDGAWKDYTSYESVSGLFRAASFVAVPLFLVSVSGFMKKRDEA
jgi:hypothetical protein